MITTAEVDVYARILANDNRGRQVIGVAVVTLSSHTEPPQPGVHAQKYPSTMS
jgi:hypothetical protein